MAYVDRVAAVSKALHGTFKDSQDDVFLAVLGATHEHLQHLRALLIDGAKVALFGNPVDSTETRLRFEIGDGSLTVHLRTYAQAQIWLLGQKTWVLTDPDTSPFSHAFFVNSSKCYGLVLFVRECAELVTDSRWKAETVSSTKTGGMIYRVSYYDFPSMFAQCFEVSDGLKDLHDPALVQSFLDAVSDVQAKIEEAASKAEQFKEVYDTPFEEVFYPNGYMNELSQMAEKAGLNFTKDPPPKKEKLIDFAKIYGGNKFIGIDNYTEQHPAEYVQPITIEVLVIGALGNRAVVAVPVVSADSDFVHVSVPWSLKPILVSYRPSSKGADFGHPGMSVYWETASC